MHDGHVHTPYCPHGSTDQLESYVKKALELNMKGITFTEHAPLPVEFVDPVPDKDSAMAKKDLEAYIEDVQKLKEKYKGRISILVGLEIDYIIGFEEQTKKILDEVGPYLDDAILSVHFLKYKENYFCLDYSPEMFKTMVDTFGSVEAIYDTYFTTLEQSIEANLGIYKPKRIGHITLVKKFQQEFPCFGNFTESINRILDKIKEKGMELDYNSAGVVKPLCGEPYPPIEVVKKAIEKKIPLIYGSDAHSVKGLCQGLDKLYKDTVFSIPNRLS
ncbi:histidinol phosphatase [Alkalihalophilus pseudofirmus]|nr:histidinol phosphatase [Alkalihalophilus pseudofirmus]